MRGAQPYRLQPGVDVTIGRGRHCQLSLYSSLLSREHARVRWEGGRPVLFDLDSLNGTFIGPDRIHRRSLREGDVIRLGDLLLMFRESNTKPRIPSDVDLPPPFDGLEQTPNEFEPGGETRLYSRTAALHQKVFDYDELGWLLEETSKYSKWILDDWISEAHVAVWFDHLGGEGGEHEHVFWHLLRTGVLAPLDHQVELTGMKSIDLAAQCAMAPRGQRLRALLQQTKVHWNEMASLRYRVRQGPIFKPLRMVARAYRPGGGLRELNLERLIYELTHIYSRDMMEPVLHVELRRLLCLGFLCPAEGTKGNAWYPLDWVDGAVELSPRGFAMLEGFRLEEEEPTAPQ